MYDENRQSAGKILILNLENPQRLYVRLISLCDFPTNYPATAGPRLGGGEYHSSHE